MGQSQSVQASRNGVASPLATIIAPEANENFRNGPSVASVSPPPIIPHEDDDRITPRAGGQLIVPREEMEDDYSAGEELDLTSGMAANIKKPGRREWIRLFRDLELQTKLLIQRPTPDSMDEEYYYIDPKLRREIENEIKSVRVFPYYNISARRYGLWIVKVTVGNSWYESLQVLLSQDANFFDTHQIRVFSDKETSARYRVKCKVLERQLNAPPQPTTELLGQAIGPDHFVNDPQHPVYQSLIEGEELK